MNTKNKIFSKIVLASLIFNLLTPFLFSNNSYAAPETGVIDNLTNVKKTRGDEKNYVEGEVIVKYRKITRQKMSLKTASLQSLGYEIKSENNSKGIANIKSETKKTSEIISELKNDKEVEYVQPNYIYELQSLGQFNDTYKDNLWGLYNFGQDIKTITGNSGSDISWDDAVKIFSGSTNTTTGTIVAVLDTGVAYNHPDLINNMWDGTNCLDNEGNALGGCIHGYDFDSDDKNPMVSYETHGTHVAGTIAATINNSKGIMGVNPNAKIMALKAQNLTTQEIVDAIAFAKYNGAKVINASFGGYKDNLTDLDLNMYNAIKDFQDNGGLFIAAAGNSTKDHNLGGSNRMFPAGFGVNNTYGTGQTTLTGLTNIISVAAIDNNDNLASFSDYGSNTVNIGAPGVSILSTIQGTGTSIYTQNFSSEYSTGNLYDFSTGGTVINNFGANYGTGGIWGDVNYPFGTGYDLSTNYSFIQKQFDISNVAIPTLSFNIWCDAGKGNSQAYTDYMALTFSTGGASYLVDRVDYWDTRLTSPLTIEGKLGYTGRLTYDLSDYKSQNFNFRFYWVSDANESTDLGCMIYGNSESPLEINDADNGSEEAYGYLNGTSMATPHVAGLASLAWGYRPDLSSSDIKNAILNNGDDVASLSGKTITGKKINAYKTLLSLSQVSNISNIKVYEDVTKQVEISTGTTVASPYVEWSDNNNPFTLSGYVFDVKDSLGNSVYSGTTTNNYFTGFTLTKSGDYNFSVYNELLGGQVGGTVTTENIHFNLNPNGDLIFSSGSYTNTGTIELSFTTSKISNYTVSGDIQNTLTGTTSSGETLNVDLTAGDGIKNISISLEDQDTNITTITGSVILDTTLPVISEINVNNGDRFATGSLTLTGLITDDNIDTLKINNENVTLSGGYFTKNISLNPGDNTINFETTDKAGNTGATSRNVIRIGTAPIVEATNTENGIDFSLTKEFAGTGILLYGTGELTNTLTGIYGTGDTFSISALSNTTYYFRAYFINNDFESLVSNTGSITSQNLGPNGSVTFSSGAYTNTGVTQISFTTNKNSNYTISGDILNTLTGTTSSGETLNVDLTAGEGIKNISILLDDGNGNSNTITGSIILDTTTPTIQNISVSNNDKFSTGSITLTGIVNDTNLGTLKINNENVTLSGGYFTKNISLNAGDNTINFEVSDLAGNTGATSRNVIRIGKAPTVTATKYFGNINFNLSKEFAGTGVLVYGTGELTNTLTGTYGTGETLSISALSSTTYYFKAYFINNGYESLVSNTGSIETPKIIDENTTGNQTVTGSTTIGNATSTGVVFTQTGTLNIKSDDATNTITLSLSGLSITTRNGNWDGIINPPTSTTSSGNITLTGYERVNLTFKAGSDLDSLTFSGGKAQVSINVGSSYNGKTFKVYRSGDNQQTYSLIDECVVSNGICSFQTSEFSYFSFLTATTTTSSSSSSGGGGGGGRGFVATCTAIQLECVDGKYQIVKGQKCTSSKVGKTCEASNYVNTMTSETSTTKTNITKKEVSYNGYTYTKYEGDAFSAKIDKVVKSIIAFDKVDDNVKEAFITNLNNFQNARYELLSASEKTDVLKNKYRKYSIILKASIKKLNENIKENTLKEKNNSKTISKQETKIVTENKVIEVQKETYKVKSYSVKLYLDSSFKTLTAWVKTGDEVELVEDLGKVVKVKITKSYAERYVGKVGYIYKSHLEKK